MSTASTRTNSVKDFERWAQTPPSPPLVCYRSRRRTGRAGNTLRLVLRRPADAAERVVEASPTSSSASDTAPRRDVRLDAWRESISDMLDMEFTHHNVCQHTEGMPTDDDMVVFARLLAEVVSSRPGLTLDYTIAGCPETFVVKYP